LILIIFIGFIIIKPKLLIVASLRSVPVSVKRYLQSMGIEVVDDLRPDSESVDALCKILHGRVVGR